MPRADRTPKADHRYGAGAHTALARRTIRSTALLRRIEQDRALRDRAVSAAESPGASAVEVARLRAVADSAQQRLDVAVMMAMADRTPPPDDRIAAAAGTDAFGLAHLRDRLAGPGRRG